MGVYAQLAIAPDPRDPQMVQQAFVTIARYLNLRFAAPTLIPTVAEPAAPAEGAVIYVDSADGWLKVKFASGNVQSLAEDA